MSSDDGERLQRLVESGYATNLEEARLLDSIFGPTTVESLKETQALMQPRKPVDVPSNT